MIKKSILTISLIIVMVIISAGIVSATQNTTTTLNEDAGNDMTLETMDNNLILNSNNEKSFADIEEKIRTSNENDVIVLNGKYNSEGKNIKIDKKLTIRGENNTIIDAKKSSGIFTITKPATFENITFTNSNCKKTGSAIYSKSDLTFINCIFTSNSQVKSNSYDGSSAIYTEKTLKLENCIFKDNTANHRIIYSAEDMTIKNCEFKNNNAEYVLYNDEYTIGIENSKFTSNKAKGIYASRLEAKDCEFIKNKMGIGYGENIIVNNCNFIGNTEYGIESVQYSKISNSNFINNKVGFKSQEMYGDMWEMITYDSTFTNCVFKSNTNTAISSANNIVIRNCIFDDNRGKTAGAIHVTSSPFLKKQATLKITDSIFKDNYAPYAGALHVQGYKVTIKNTKFTNNKKSSIIITDANGYFDGNRFNVAGKLTINSKKYKNINLNDKLRKVELVKVSVKKVKTSKSKHKLQVKLMNKLTKKPVKHSEICLKVKTGKKVKKYYLNTNKKGIASFSTSKLIRGNHKIEITSLAGVCNIEKTILSVKVTKSKITVKNAKTKTITKAPKVTCTINKSKTFKVSIKNKKTKKPISNVMVKLKIDNKIFKIKTNSKGTVKFNTKNLNAGKHKVTVTSGNSKYIISAKSTINIKNI